VHPSTHGRETNRRGIRYLGMGKRKNGRKTRQAPMLAYCFLREKIQIIRKPLPPFKFTNL